MIRWTIIIFAFFTIQACESQTPVNQKCWKVTASAYNSLPYQTRPGTSGNITAWGDTLNDTIPSIAISRDLLDSGLVYGTMVYIEGYTYPFVVNDKMNKRYKNKIDLHLGKNVQKAMDFGRKKLRICIDIPIREEEIEVTSTDK